MGTPAKKKPQDLSPAQMLAIPYVYNDILTDAKISEILDIDRGTLLNWKKLPAFVLAVEELRARELERIMKIGIGNRDARLKRMDRHYKGLQLIVEQRAEASDGEAPGLDTGLLVRRKKSVGYGPSTEVIEEVEVDTGLLAEIRALEAAALKELAEIDPLAGKSIAGIVWIEDDAEETAAPVSGQQNGTA